MSTPAEREEALFEAALQLPVDKRSAFLDAACLQEPELRRAVDALLEAHEQTRGPLDGAAMPQEKTLVLSMPPTEKPGDKIGRYKLLQQLGEGGCGVVYMAEQLEPVRRRVALKIIKLGMDTRQVMARFEAERQALALMDHPNIAKVFDAGSTETGRPYFVMELVRGAKITDFCDEHQLTTEERLKLMIQICQAVQHAHQKGVIHRDLKPSNILVGMNDGVPIPKVIDFGIAKATLGRLTDQTVFTAFEQFMGTPAYMSPEQAVLTSVDVDTRSDIYSLGVLTYELLTGKTPFGSKELVEAGLDEMRRTIREKEPQKPSTCLSTMLDGDLHAIARHRQAAPPRLIHIIRGDLDWIVMKCLEKDRGRRYETANGLAADLQRHLGNQPVVARPPANLYRFRKMVQRNKMAVGAAGAIAVALVLGLIVSLWQARQAKQARLNTEAINRFLTEEILLQATPAHTPREKRISVEEVLDRASQKLESDAEIARRPEVEAALRLAIGSTYSRLGMLNEAERHLRRSVLLRRKTLGPRHVATLDAQLALTELLVVGARKFDEGEALGRETWEARRQMLGTENRQTLDSLCLYAIALVEQEKWDEAVPLTRQYVESCDRVFGPQDPDSIVALVNLGSILQSKGDVAESEPYIREALKRYKIAGRGDDRDTLLTIKNLGSCYFFLGNGTEALSIFEDLHPRLIRALGAEHSDTLHIQHFYARVLADQGNLEKAETLAKETLEVRRRVSPEHEGTARTLLILGRILVAEGKPKQAEPYFRDSLTLFREHYARKPGLAAQAENALGGVLLEDGNLAEAERLLEEHADLLIVKNAELCPKERRVALGYLVKLYELKNKPEKVAYWLKLANEKPFKTASSH